MEGRVVVFHRKLRHLQVEVSGLSRLADGAHGLVEYKLLTVCQNGLVRRRSE
jgi:hypothetical protein